MFVQMMLKSMREALQKMVLFSDQTRHQHTSMYDQQIAQQMTAGKLGLADMIWLNSGMTGGRAVPADDAPQVPLKFSTETDGSYQNQALLWCAKPRKTPDSSDAPLSGDERLSGPAFRSRRG